MRETLPPELAERPEGTAVAVVLADDPPPAPNSCGGVVGFNYSTLPAEAAERARRAADGIRRAQRASVQEIGRHLSAAKEALPHGSFTPWAVAELGMTARTAQRYMQAAAFLDGKPDTVSLLPPTLIYDLAAPSTPAEVVQQVVDAAERGAPLPPAEIEKRLGAAKDAAREAEAAAKAAARLLRKNPGLSAKEAKAHAAKLREQRERRQEAAAEQSRREAEAREARLRAVVADVAPLCRPHAAALRAALSEDSYTFAKMLRTALAELEAEA
jgi:hypothetical protein